MPKVRRILQEDLEAQLARLGLRCDQQHLPVGEMQLSEDSGARRHRVEALLRRDAVAEGSDRRGFENVVRELTYTNLNRLVGLKAMEARKVLYLPPPGHDGVPEQTEVVTPIPGQARSRYLRDFRAAGGSRYKYEDDAEEALLRDGLTAAYRAVDREIRLLFDPEHEYACVWPTHACLVTVIGMINNDLPEEAYQARDFLGWVYQFFNREEKKRVRAENKGTPRSSYELAVMNQFYTPSWVVKVLVDNTLGRLWLQMHPDSALRGEGPPPLPEERTSDVPVADYLVPRTGEDVPYQRVTESGEVERFKRVRDITLLDPACGTMHFGQYAFGLFHQMYLEEIERAGEPGWPEEPSVKEPPDIPAAIIENNLFGIDIDPRAIQIASLSLLLTAKEAALRHDMSPVDVKVRRSNLVVANAVNLGKDRLRKLVDRLGSGLGSPELQERLFSTLWENLQYVGELGSLVQVREGVARVLDDWVEARAGGKGLRSLPPKDETQLELGGWITEREQQRAHQFELEQRLLKEELGQLQEDLLCAVETAAAEVDTDPTDRLFAEDTARGLQLLQLLSRHYDVVVMNPPYGTFVPKVKEFVKAVYPITKHDIYAAFIDRASQLTEPEGFGGALVSRTFVAQVSARKLREDILLKRNPIILFVDLGGGILDDATVEAAAVMFAGKGINLAPDQTSCASVTGGENEIPFFDLERFRSVDRHGKDLRHQVFARSFREKIKRLRFNVAKRDFRTIEGSPLAFRLIESAAYIFRHASPIEPFFGEVKLGAHTSEDGRLVRYWWEVANLTPRKDRVYLPFAKGGPFSRFYYDIFLRVAWDPQRCSFHKWYGRKGRPQERPEAL
ncbi:MAG: hypothetical protein GY856_22075, partial [bacterium]|nr:hypothetical protein [bacterium]